MILNSFLTHHLFSFPDLNLLLLHACSNALSINCFWSTLWQLPVSIPKCSILSISNSKLVRPRHYLIGNHPLPQVSTCSDLGVIIDTHLSFSHHILSTAKKASRQSALILRCFLSRDADNLKLAFCTYVRPIVENASPIWSPHTQKDTDLLENVQRRFTKSISKLHYLPYTARLSCLNIPTLSCRRTRIDLCTVFRYLAPLYQFEPYYLFYSSSFICHQWSSFHTMQTTS